MSNRRCLSFLSTKAFSPRGEVRPVKMSFIINMDMVDFGANRPKCKGIDLLDVYTAVSLESYWKEKVNEAKAASKELNKTGKTETSETGEI